MIFRSAPLLIALVAAAACASAQTPHILWQFDTRDASFGQTAAGDIDGDGRLELVFGCYRNDGMVYALNAEDGSLLWTARTADSAAEGCNDAAPLLLDVDGDGRLEVVVAASCTAVTVCLDGRSGARRWTVPTRGSDSPPSAADVDGDGRPEILHGEFGGYVRCINADSGTTAWELAVDTRSWIQTAPTIADLDSNGLPDFVVATWNADSGATNRVTAYRGSDRVKLWSYALGDVAYHGTAVADADGDGDEELFIGDYNGTLHALHARTGAAVWTHRPTRARYIGAPVSAGDLDGDGSLELVAVNGYLVMAYRGNGAVMWEHSIANFAGSFRGAALADIDGDGRHDVIFGSSAGQLTALRGTTGAPLWSMDLAAHFGDPSFQIDHAPVIADLNGDDTLDVFIVGGHTSYPDIQNNYGRGYAISAGRGAGPDWLMFQNNIRRDCRVAQPVVLAAPSPPPAPSVVRLYPQPAHDAIAIEARGLERVDLFDRLGRLLSRTPAAGGRCAVALDGVPPGLYLALLSSAEGMRAARIVKE